MRRCIHVIISGRVQGVGYRAWTTGTASRLGVDGWVRNRRDGTVEAVFAAVQPALDALLDACRNGPPAARVDDITISDHTAPVASGFHHRDTV